MQKAIASELLPRSSLIAEWKIEDRMLKISLILLFINISFGKEKRTEGGNRDIAAAGVVVLSRPRRKRERGDSALRSLSRACYLRRRSLLNGACSCFFWSSEKKEAVMGEWGEERGRR